MNSANRPLHLYLSPHLDDVPLSCAGLIKNQRKLVHRVLVVTFFTGDSAEPLSPLAERYHALWNRGARPFAWRRQEDAAAALALGAEFRHEGMLDAIYRTAQSGSPLYSSVAATFETVHDEDTGTINEIEARASSLIGRLRPTYVYAPAGIGRHVDHQAVILASKRIQDQRPTRLRLYEEWPYASGTFPKERSTTLEEALRLFDWLPADSTTEAIDLAGRIAVARCYSSQIEELFGDDQTMCKMVEEYSFRIGGAEPAERYWTPRRS
jgi:LmbE family N-acetylglucosaminyl deacetylase